MLNEMLSVPYASCVTSEFTGQDTLDMYSKGES